MSSPRSWSEVKPRLLRQRESLADTLITAELKHVRDIQRRIQLIDQIIEWFEDGSPEDKMIGGDTDVPGY